MADEVLASHHTWPAISSSSFKLLLSLKVLQPWDVGQILGTPGSHPAAPHPPSPAPEQRFVPRKPSCLQIQSCALSSYIQSNQGSVYNYSYYFFLYYAGSKNPISVLHVHLPPHYLNIVYFPSLHLLFEKTPSKVLS